MIQSSYSDHKASELASCVSAFVQELTFVIARRASGPWSRDSCSLDSTFFEMTLGRGEPRLWESGLGPPEAPPSFRAPLCLGPAGCGAGLFKSLAWLWFLTGDPVIHWKITGQGGSLPPSLGESSASCLRAPFPDTWF